ncbi:DUF397 domain-containing protein [Streptomyces djakartensis]|uniref:DUF397 domain-containing protein n=1 Tax=Streptomyces djakartensis TaxID=68193 RepID=A0ABQ2ZJV2_9ACTN|nr:DUF397 domain-containing protein [Streptomyces djakartensis]GGY17940.1 hypothetical protein GCM10010384_25190 [Streptomyces djakartensis]
MISSEHTGWFKSSYSGGSQAECLEVAPGPTTVPVRDSKTTDGPALLFSAGGWTAFLTAVKEGRIKG